MKKLKESNDIKSKRIINLEAQVEEAKNTITKHKCHINTNEVPGNATIVNDDGLQQVKIAVLESKTNSIEQNMILLASKDHFLKVSTVFSMLGKFSDSTS